MMTTNQLAEAVAPPPTVSERLMEVVAKLCPKKMARYNTTRVWGPDHPTTVAPYAVKTVGDLHLVQVSSEDGDVIGGIGLTTAEAVTRLRKKVGLEQEESDA